MFFRRFQGFLGYSRKPLFIFKSNRRIQILLRSLMGYALFLFVCGICSANAQTYSGQATGIQATVITGIVPGVTTAVTDTGPLPNAGGTITLSSASANVPNILTAGASTVTASGSGSTSQSTASVATLNVSPAGILSSLFVTADAVSSTTLCSCPAATCTGSSTITNLRVGGAVVTVDNSDNQTFVFTAGTVTLTVVVNEKIISPSSETVNALHIKFADSLSGITTDVIVASSHSDIVCVAPPSSDLYSGRATGVRLGLTTTVPVSEISTVVTDTGFLPTSGGNIAASTASTTVPGVLSTGTITSTTAGGSPAGTAQSNSTVNSLNASLVGSVTVAATVLQSNTQCTCGVPTVCSGGSTVTNLAVTIGGLPFGIAVTGAANETFPLPAGLGTIIVNEQTPVSPTTGGNITVNALHVILTPVGLASTDLIIASSHSDIACSLMTAANVSISGRVTNGKSSAVKGAIVTATDMTGTPRTAVTNAFGYYMLRDLPSGGSYVVQVTQRMYTFAPRVITLGDNLSGFDFSAESGGMVKQ